MADYCTQLENLNLKAENPSCMPQEPFMCKITGLMCVGSTFDDPDTGGYGKGSRTAGFYNDSEAKNCPAYNIPNNIANLIKKHNLELQKSELEQQIADIEGQIE
ncbi:MAG: hypothetical protein V1914_04570 [archaeon]